MQILTLQKPHIPASFNVYLVINKCVTAVKFSNFSGHYLRNRSTLGVGVLDYIGIVQHKEHSPEVLSIPPGTPCIYIYIYTHTHTNKLTNKHSLLAPEYVIIFGIEQPNISSNTTIKCLYSVGSL